MVKLILYYLLAIIFILFRVIIIIFINWSFFDLKQRLLIKLLYINPSFLNYLLLLNIMENYFRLNNFISLATNKFFINYI